ncbi:myosin heavy chain, non-muscle-like [Saccostrea cucullata]|uniref:myosin heavy chain, non-muscle-like n=1 Tax=Saccostrea cuccullata TaxID=36930 RepID=UPI002ED27130
MEDKLQILKFDKPWYVMVEDHEMCQSIFDDLLEKVDREIAIKNKLDALMARAQERQRRYEILKFDRPWCEMVEEPEICESIFDDLLEKVDREIAIKNKLDALMARAQERQRRYEILKFDRPWCEMVEEPEICESIFDDLLEKVDREIAIKNKLDALMARAQERQRRYEILKFDRPWCEMVEEPEICESIFDDLLEKVDREIAIKNKLDALMARAQERQRRYEILKFDRPWCEMVEEPEICESIFDDLLEKVDREIAIKNKLDALMARAQERQRRYEILKFDRPWCEMVEEPEICESIFDDLLEKVDREIAIKNKLDALMARAQERQRRYEILKFDRPWCEMVEEPEICEDILDDLTTGVETEDDTQHFKHVMATVLDELKSKIPVLQEQETTLLKKDASMKDTNADIKKTDNTLSVVTRRTFFQNMKKRLRKMFFSCCMKQGEDCDTC